MQDAAGENANLTQNEVGEGNRCISLSNQQFECNPFYNHQHFFGSSWWVSLQQIWATEANRREKTPKAGSQEPSPSTKSARANFPMEIWDPQNFLQLWRYAVGVSGQWQKLSVAAPHFNVSALS